MAEMIAPSELQPPAPRFRPWKQMALYSAMIMELSWIALWGRSLLWRAGPHPYFRVLVTLSGMYFLMYLVTWFSDRVALRLVYRRALFAFALLACLAIGLDVLTGDLGRFDFWEFLGRPLETFQQIADLIPIEFLILIMILYICWRGILLASAYIEPVGILVNFRNGIIIFFLYGLVYRLTENTPLLALDLFLFASLLALSSSRIAVLGQLRGGQAIVFDRRWLGVISLAVLSVVGIAIAIGNLMRGSGFILLSRIFTIFLNILLVILTPLVWLVEQLIFWFGEKLNLDAFFNFLIDLFNDVQVFFENLVSAITSWVSQGNLEQVGQIISRLAVYKPLIMWGTILLFLLMVVLAVRRYIRRQKEEPDDAEMESLIEQQDLIDLLRDALKRGLGRMMGELERLAGLRQARRWLAAARIRRIYARLMDLCAQLNRPRPASHTPLEFLPELWALFPGLNSELETITNAYVRVRYGDLPETDRDVESVEAAWRLVSRTGQEQIRVQKRLARLRY